MASIVIDPKYALSDSEDDAATGDDRGGDSQPKCLNCGASFAELKKCSRCRAVYFCNAACQRAVWAEHSPNCVKDPNAKERPKAPEPPRMPTAAEKEAAKANEKKKIEEDTLPKARAACDALLGGGGLHANQGVSGEFEDIIEALEDAIVFAIGEEDAELSREVRLTLSKAYLCARRLDECVHYLTPELEHARREGGEESASVHLLAARARSLKGEKEQCRKELTAALDCASESTSESKQGESLLEAGLILHDIGDWEKCAPILSTAGEAMEKLDRKMDASRAYNRAGSALFRLGRPDQAARCWLRELKTLESDESVTTSMLAQAHGNVASAFLLAGDQSTFNLHKEQALGKAREAGAEDEARVLLQLGNAYKLAGETVDDSLAMAKDCFEKVKSISKVGVVVDTATKALEMMNCK